MRWWKKQTVISKVYKRYIEDLKKLGIFQTSIILIRWLKCSFQNQQLFREYIHILPDDEKDPKIKEWRDLLKNIKAEAKSILGHGVN